MKQSAHVLYSNARIWVVAALLSSFGLLSIHPAAAQSPPVIETSADQAFLADFETGTVLLAKNADARMYPSSMTKMMTAYMLFQRLRNGSLSLDDELEVSEKAWRKGGSKMFVEVGTRVRVEDLLRGIIVQSGNDATIVVAEGLSGSEDAFAREMTETARAIGMTNTQFRNASGWPDPEHYTTARDLAILAMRTIQDFPEFYHMYNERAFTYNNITQQNRNPLFGRVPGADGLKTGRTEAAGYGLTGSAIRGDQRLIMVLNGLETSRDRRDEAARIMEWGFREFGTFRLFEGGETVEEVPVWLGQDATVPLIVQSPVEIVMRHAARDQMTATLRTLEPIAAPIVAGDPAGEVVIEAPGMDALIVPVVAGESVARLGSFGRIQAALEYLVFGESGG